MQADFNLNIPCRQQALDRNDSRNYQQIPRGNRSPSLHGCHVFCQECFSRIFLGTAAFKLYLFGAWCIGLAGLTYLQKPKSETEIAKGITHVWIGITLTYLVSQVFGLLAVVTEIEKIFVPYTIVLVVVTVANIIFLSLAIVVSTANTFGNITFGKDIFGVEPLPFAGFSILFLIYNILCLLSVLNLCSYFDKKRILAERRRRELIAHNARIYNRLTQMNTRDEHVTVNVDSPPNYSSLVSKLDNIDTPPPGYSQLDIYENVEGTAKRKENSCRALFQDP